MTFLKDRYTWSTKTVDKNICTNSPTNGPQKWSSKVSKKMVIKSDQQKGS